MNATEFFFAATAVFSATGIIFAWYSWIYGLDDGYQESLRKRKGRKQSLRELDAK
jgi:hypothetical protein